MLDDSRILVTGGAGFLGRAVCAELHKRNVREVFIPRRAEYDLTQQDAVRRLFDIAKPKVVIHLAAEVGGIGANRQHPGRFFYVNAMMGINLIEEARIHSVEKFVQVGTTCSYPCFCHTPFIESDLWNGYPEKTNSPYGIAKRCLETMLHAYRREYGLKGIYLIPANLYGPHDNFDPETSHVIPALIRKFTRAVERNFDIVCVWGTGDATREFLYVKDCAEGIVKALVSYSDSSPMNLGTGQEISIRELVALVARFTGYYGIIEWDRSKPDGQMRRRLDVSRAAITMDWRATTSLEAGLRSTIDWWRHHVT